MMLDDGITSMGQMHREMDRGMRKHCATPTKDMSKKDKTMPSGRNAG